MRKQARERTPEPVGQVIRGCVCQLLVFLANTHAAAIRTFRSRRGVIAVGRDLLEHVLDGGIELGITTTDHQRGIINHFDVRVGAVAFDSPRAVVLIETERGSADEAVIDKAGVAGKAHETAPRSHANELADSGLLEQPGEHVAAGTRHAIDEHALGPLMGIGGEGPILALTHGPVVGVGSIQQFNETGRNLTTAVPSFIDNEAILTLLAEELSKQVVLAVDAGILNLDITDLAICHFFNVGSVSLDPASISQVRFVSDRFDEHFAGLVIDLGLLADGE